MRRHVGRSVRRRSRHLLKRTIVAIHQPAYLPWFGLLEKIALCDRFVVLDTVQYNARAFQHRTLYSTGHGPKYLSLAVSSKGHQVNATAIQDITLTDLEVPGRHFETLRHRYGKRPGWPVVAPDLERILMTPDAKLIDLNLALLQSTLRAFRDRYRDRAGIAVRRDRRQDGIDGVADEGGGWRRLPVGQRRVGVHGDRAVRRGRPRRRVAVF